MHLIIHEGYCETITDLGWRVSGAKPSFKGVFLIWEGDARFPAKTFYLFPPSEGYDDIAYGRKYCIEQRTPKGISYLNFRNIYSLKSFLHKELVGEIEIIQVTRLLFR